MKFIVANIFIIITISFTFINDITSFDVISTRGERNLENNTILPTTSISSPDRFLATNELNKSTDVQAAILKKKNRKPTSIPNPSDSIFPKTRLKLSALPLALDDQINVDINCKISKNSFSVNKAEVFMSGKKCKINSEIKIINLTNGYTASIFSLAEDYYKTDLIPMDEGENQLVIESSNDTKVPSQFKLKVNYSKSED